MHLSCHILMNEHLSKAYIRGMHSLRVTVISDYNIENESFSNEVRLSNVFYYQIVLAKKSLVRVILHSGSCYTRLLHWQGLGNQKGPNLHILTLVKEKIDDFKKNNH